MWTQESARWFSRTGGCLTVSSALPVPTPTSANPDCPRPSKGQSKSRCPKAPGPESIRSNKAGSVRARRAVIASGEPPDLSTHHLRAPNAARAEGDRHQRRPPAPASLPRARRRQHRNVTWRSPRPAESGYTSVASSPCRPPASVRLGPADPSDLAGWTLLGRQPPSPTVTAHTRSLMIPATPPAMAVTPDPPCKNRARPSTCRRPPLSPTAAGDGTSSHRQRGEAMGEAQRRWRRDIRGGVANRNPRSPDRCRPALHHPSSAGRPP